MLLENRPLYTFGAGAGSGVGSGSCSFLVQACRQRLKRMATATYEAVNFTGYGLGRTNVVVFSKLRSGSFMLFQLTIFWFVQLSYY